MNLIKSTLLIISALLLNACVAPDNSSSSSANVSLSFGKSGNGLSRQASAIENATSVQIDICLSRNVDGAYSNNNLSCFQFFSGGTKTISVSSGTYLITGRIILNESDYYYAVSREQSFSNGGSNSLTLQFLPVSNLFDTNIDSGTYTDDQSFVLTQTGSIDELSYSLDGSSYFTYSSPISVSGDGTDQTIKIKIVKNGFDLFSEFRIQIDQNRTSTPNFNISDSSTFYLDQVVEITSDRPSAVIYYTTNDSVTPSSSDTLYTGPITYDSRGNYTIKAIAYETGLNESTINQVDFDMELFEEMAYFKSSDPDPDDIFGCRVAIDGDLLVIGSQWEDGNITGIQPGPYEAGNGGTNFGAAYIFKYDSGSWTQTHYVKPESITNNDQFGARLDIHDDTIVVGINEDSSAIGITDSSGSIPTDNGAINSGAVYVYRQSGDDWVREAFIKRLASEADDYFYFPKVYDETLVVSSFGDDSSSLEITNGTSIPTDNNSTDVGAIFVYNRSGDQWSHKAMIKASGLYDSAEFGVNFDFAQNTIVVAVPGDGDETTGIQYGENISTNQTSTNVGSVWVFDLSGDDWIQTAYIKAPNGESGDQFGYNHRSVAYDNNTLVVGAPFEDENTTSIINGGSPTNLNAGGNNGAAYVYIRENGIWSLQAYLKASNSQNNDWFGTSVAIEGDMIAVTAEFEDNAAQGIQKGTSISESSQITQSGAVYIFQRTGTTWEQVAYIKAPNNSDTTATAPFAFGNSSLSISGSRLLVGHEHEDNSAIGVVNSPYSSNDGLSDNSGAAFLFER